MELAVKRMHNRFTIVYTFVRMCANVGTQIVRDKKDINWLILQYTDIIALLFLCVIWHGIGKCRPVLGKHKTTFLHKEITIMGRMRENPRYNVISMRVSDEEREQLESLVRRTHKSVSDIMREAMTALTIELDHRDMRKAA